MTPIQQINQLKTNFLFRIQNLFNQDPDIFSIEFDPEPLDDEEIDIEVLYLSRDGVLTTLDEFSNEIDDKLDALTIEVVAYILTLIENKKYSVYERI
jgi:hypothetical protein